jgi:DNA-binding transcriptional regulator YiaG
MENMNVKREHSIVVGRYRVIGEYDAVQLDDGSFAISNEDFGRLGLQAAIAVFQQSETIQGGELRFARKAMGLKQPELAALLDVATETVSRWETNKDPIRRQTQLAVLLLLEHTARFGHPVPLAPSNDSTLPPVRIVAA